MRSLIKSDYLKLVPILALAYYLTFIPHSYPYPIHVDEWVHFYRAEAMLTAGSTTYTSYLYGETTAGLSSNLESGFHLFWGIFQRISGLDWLTIFRYFPGIIFLITVLSVYVLARREGYGWQAAFCTCLIPTTVGILGPAFLVPVAMGLLFIPLLLFLAFHFRSAWSYLVIFIFTSFLLSIHAPTAVVIAMMLIPFILLGIKGDFRHSVLVTAAVAIPFLAPFPWIFDLLLPTAIKLLNPVPPIDWIDFPRVIYTYGMIPVGLCLLGTFLLVMRGGRKNYSLVLGLAAILIMLATFYTLRYGIPIMYDRGLMYMMLMMSIITGAGLAGFNQLRLPENLTRIPARLVTATGHILCLVLVVVILVVTIPQHQDIPYYHMIDREDYESFVWIRDNLSTDYDKAVLDPWKATAFSAITQKAAYTRIHEYPKPSDTYVYNFLEGGCNNTNFLRENGITLIYARKPVTNPDLTEVRKFVYVLKETGN